MSNMPSVYFDSKDAETIRRLQREWRIAKRKELEEKKRKKKFRKMEASPDDARIHDSRYGDLNTAGVSLPQTSTPHTRFPFRTPAVHTHLSTSGTSHLGTTHVGGTSQHPPYHYLDQDEQKQKRNLSQHHSMPQMSRSMSFSQEPHVSSHPALHPSRELGHYSLSTAPNETSATPSATLGMSSVLPMSQERGEVKGQIVRSIEQSAHEYRYRDPESDEKELSNNNATSHASNAMNPFLSVSKHDSAIVTGDEPGVSHVQSLISMQRPPAMGNTASVPGAEGAPLPDEIRKKIEVEEAQRQWRENKRKELAMKRARSASSRRGRKRVKLTQDQSFITQPVQVLSSRSSLQASVSFPTAASMGNGFPVSSNVPTAEGSEHVQVSPPVISPVGTGSIGVSISEPISASIAVPSSVPLSGTFSHSSIPIPSSVAVPVVPALPVRSASGSGYGTGNDSDAGINPLALNSSHQYLSTSTSERIQQQSVMAATAVNIAASDEGDINVYTSAPQGTTNNTIPAATTPGMPAAPSAGAAALLNSESRQNENRNVLGKGFTDSQSEPMSMGPTSETKEHLRNQTTDNVDCEKDESRTPKEGEGGDHFQGTEQEDCSKRNTRLELVERANSTTITHEAENRLPERGCRTGTTRQADEQGKRTEETSEKEFEDPRDSYHADGEDDLIHSVTWPSLASIENP